MFWRFGFIFSVFLTAAGLITLEPCAALAQKRIALVIGNSAYRNIGAMHAPSNDAKAMGELFRSGGFDDVRVVNDLGLQSMKEELRTFSSKAAGADVAVVYYAGHGAKVGDREYLIPTDAILARETDLADNTMDLETVQRAIKSAKRLRLVLFDASRDDPFARARSPQSLSPAHAIAASNDALVAFATRAGATVAESEGPHSVFTAALLHHLMTPGLDVLNALGNARDEVLRTTNGKQEPVVNGALNGENIALLPEQKGHAQQGRDPPAERWADFDRAKLGSPERQKLAPTPPQEMPGQEAPRQEAPRQDALPQDAPWQDAPRHDAPRQDTPRQDAPLQVAPREDVPPREAFLQPPPPADKSVSCGDVVPSWSSRSPRPLSVDEECALKPANVFKECDTCPEMVVVPPGSFVMGSPPTEAGRNGDEGPQHEVAIARPFAVAKFDVTRDQFAEFVAETGYDAGSACYVFSGQDWEQATGMSWRNPGFDQTGMHPVVCVSWNDAQAYVDWLRRKTGRHYRLLSEAEWEYAARAPMGPMPERTTWCGCGGRTIISAYPRYFFGDNDRQICRYANGLDVQGRLRVKGMQRWPAFTCSDGFAYTSPVGTYLPNAFGLYDMLGDVWQWTQDCYAENYLDVPTDGSAEIYGACTHRVRRGGSWSSIPWHLRAAMRMKDIPDGRNDSSGIRVARTIAR